MRHLKIESLPNSKVFLDRDMIMLHACFQILKDFVEIENGDELCDYDEHKDFVDEVRFLYDWWEIRKKGEEGLTESTTKDLILFYNERDDNEMLSRLMEIRNQMWT